MAKFLIPLINQAQTLTISLAGKTYGLSLRWCVPSNAWTLDIADSSGVPMLTGIPLVTGADLLDQYPDMYFGGKLIVENNDGSQLPPTYTSLGTIGNLYFVTL